MSKRTVDALIVGQGLAGTNLAFALIKRGWTVRVVNEPGRRCASRVAAGILNPVTGQRLVKSWRVEEQLPEARAFYREQEERLGASFFTEREIRRICRSESEIARWEKRMKDPAYASFLGERLNPGALGETVADERGSFRIVRVASLEPDDYLDAARKWLRANGCLLETRLDPRALCPGNGEVTGGSVTARRVIFATGWREQESRWFDFLPFSPAKGEILTLRTGALPPEHILNASKWILPVDSSTVRIGSTYEWDRLDEETTSAAREELLKHFQLMLPGQPEPQVMDHRAGVRPATRDRKPFLGLHPVHPELAVFNGFGSKGALMTPWAAERMAAFLHEGKPLPRDASIERFSR